MAKIRVLSDQLANQIAAGEVVERPASVAKELVENAIDAKAGRISIDFEAGGRRLLKITDDGEGMSRDDAILAFERHATSKIATASDLAAITTLGFRGEALASIAAVAKIELTTKSEGDQVATSVIIEGGRMRDVKDAAHPAGTTIVARDLFFNVPARRKFLRSEATESYHLTNLVTHYALAHPEISFELRNNGREIIRASPARDLRERAYQIFGAPFLESLLEVNGGIEQIATVSGFVSAPRERRTSRDAQYLFVNGRFVKDRLLTRALSEGYRSVLPYGSYPAALLFLNVPPDEVDVNVHPAKTEVRFRRAAAVSDVIRERVRGALASGGFVGRSQPFDEPWSTSQGQPARPEFESSAAFDSDHESATRAGVAESGIPGARADSSAVAQERIEFGFQVDDDQIWANESFGPDGSNVDTDLPESSLREEFAPENMQPPSQGETPPAHLEVPPAGSQTAAPILPPLPSAAKLVEGVELENISANIRPLGQLEESFIIATDDEGLLLIDQHVAHERILFDKYRRLESERRADSQRLLLPETFDLTPGQAAAFDIVVDDLESYGFELMRLSGRTVAVKAVPADLPPIEARTILSEVLDAVEAEKRGKTREVFREEIAASLACRAAIKINMPLTAEKMRWLIDRLLLTSSPTTCPHGRPVILRLSMRDIEKGFHRPQKPGVR